MKDKQKIQKAQCIKLWVFRLLINLASTYYFLSFINFWDVFVPFFGFLIKSS